MSAMLSRVVILTAGTLYPAYRSYKAVRTKDVREYVKWMMYWIVFGLFCFVETLADVLVAFWFPFYYEAKMLFVLWLLSPWTKGASILYRKWIHPTLAKHERGIDTLLDQAKNEGYNTVLRLGSQGLLCAREIVTTAAVRGQMQLVQQIQRSVSLNDVTDGVAVPRQRMRIEEIHEEEDGHVTDRERVWEGTYDEAGNMVDEEFRYLEEQQDVDTGPQDDTLQPPRRSSRQRKTTPPDRFATIPRSTTTRGTKKRTDLF